MHTHLKLFLMSIFISLKCSFCSPVDELPKLNDKCGEMPPCFITEYCDKAAIPKCRSCELRCKDTMSCKFYCPQSWLFFANGVPQNEGEFRLKQLLNAYRLYLSIKLKL